MKSYKKKPVICMAYAMYNTDHGKTNISLVLIRIEH
jgi:hypothetical protein